MTCKAVFVYGTLQLGEVNAQYFDEFEGADYPRVITQVCLANGAVADAYVYELAIE